VTLLRRVGMVWDGLECHAVNKNRSEVTTQES
jgi:hypothetical protein